MASILLLNIVTSVLLLVQQCKMHVTYTISDLNSERVRPLQETASSDSLWGTRLFSHFRIIIRENAFTISKFCEEKHAHKGLVKIPPPPPESVNA